MLESFPIRFPMVSLVLVSLATLDVSGCAGPRSEVISVNAPVTKAGVLFVADGAGDFRACSQKVRQAAEVERFPLQVVTVPWSHGYGRILADQTNYSFGRAQGEQLAQVISRFEHEHPGVPVYLMGHSAGTAVIMAALENLPPDAVNRAFLLAPSLSATYDVRPALRAVREGLHVYYSHKDTLYLGVWTGILGNSDRRWGASSGRIGFQPPPSSLNDSYLYGKLIQRAWHPSDQALGNDGKHYGDYQPEFVRAHILPFISH
jgi:pimeloyl-ACP methyl ester carboxylesterase